MHVNLFKFTVITIKKRTNLQLGLNDIDLASSILLVEPNPELIGTLGIIVDSDKCEVVW